MKRRIGIVTIIAGLLMLIGIGLWAGQSVYAGETARTEALVANMVASSDAQVSDEDGMVMTSVESDSPAASVNTQVSDEDGIVITSVEPGSPAAEAGVKRGNILLQIDDQEVKSLMDVHQHLESVNVGDEVTLNLLHGDESRTLTVTTGDRDGHAYLGITSCDGMEHIFETEIFLDGDDPFLHHLDDFDMSEFETHTLIVEEVLAGEAAEAAGLQKGDQIVALNGTESGTGEEFVAELLTHQPGDTVTLTIQREGEANPIDVEVTLGENESGEAFLGIGLGVEVEMDIEIEGDMGMMPSFHFDHDALPEGDFQGAVIDKIKEGGAAEAAELQEGDIITAIDGEALTHFDSLISALATHQPNDTVTLSVWRNGETLDVSVTLGASKAGKAQLGAQVGFIQVGKVINGNEVEIEEEIMIDSSTQ